MQSGGFSGAGQAYMTVLSKKTKWWPRRSESCFEFQLMCLASKCNGGNCTTDIDKQVVYIVIIDWNDRDGKMKSKDDISLSPPPNGVNAKAVNIAHRLQITCSYAC
jgi:hypothetical protein